MGTKRVGLARTQALLQSLKRELLLTFSTKLRSGAVQVQEEDSGFYGEILCKSSGTTAVNTGAATTTLSSFIPARAIPLALAINIDTAITNDAYIKKVGYDADDDAWGGTLADGALEQAGDRLTLHFNPAAGKGYFESDTDLKLVGNATAGAGKIQVTMLYILGTPMTD